MQIQTAVSERAYRPALIDRSKPRKYRHFTHLTTGRKLSIKALSAAGLSNREIARREKVSSSTVGAILLDKELDELEPQIIEKTAKMLGSRFVVLADRSITKAQEEKRLNRMSSYQLAGIAGLAFARHRVAAGLSTENLSVRGVVEHLTSEESELRKRRLDIEERLKRLR